MRSKDRKRPKSRSRSRERRKEEGSQRPPRSSSTTTFSKLEEQKEKKKVKVLPRVPLKEESERKEREIKQQMLSSGLKSLSVLSVSEVKKESDSNDIKTERLASLSTKLLKESKLLKEIKKEKPAFDMLEESLDSKPIKKEKPLSMFSTVKDLQQHKEIEKEHSSALIKEACTVSTSDIADQKDQALQETVKTEPIWPEPPQHLTSNIQTGQSSPSFSTLSTHLVPAPPQAAESIASQQGTPSLIPPVPEALTETPPLVQPISVNPEKHEVEEPSDDDMDVDMMLDSLDYVKTEPGGESGEAGVKQEKEGEGEEGKTEGEPVPVMAGAKAKPSVKRVTWNLQEPEGPQPEKTGTSEYYCTLLKN